MFNKILNEIFNIKLCFAESGVTLFATDIKKNIQIAREFLLRYSKKLSSSDTMSKRIKFQHSN